MKSISKPRDTQDTTDKKEQEFNKKVDEFFDEVRTELKFYDVTAKLKNYNDTTNDTTLKEFEKMVSDLKADNTRLEFRLDLFKVITEFYIYDEAKEKVIKIFCEFLKHLVISKTLVKPIDVLKYENYLKGLELIKIAINWQDDGLDGVCEVVDSPQAEIKREFYTFKGKIDTYFKRFDYPEVKKDYEIRTSKQRINNNFNEQMYKVAELYQLPISEKTYKRTLSNEITRYLIPNTTGEELN